MTQYIILDTIADAYNIVLLMMAIIGGILDYRSGYRLSWLKCVAGIVICYLVMWFDQTTLLWSSFSLDYSTHSSVALALIVYLIHRVFFQKQPTLLFLGSLISYYLLEIYQDYHTPLDIITTVVVILPLLFCVYHYMSWRSHPS